MNLRDQLRDILPTILPKNPAQAIKGTELIELVKYGLKQNYSDATLRYHFSIMSCDPSSPIAKVEQGQGYYLRSTTIHSLNSARNIIGDTPGLFTEDTTMNAEGQDVALQRAGKFRAVFQHYWESENQFPFIFEKSFSDEHALTNQWRYPDAAIINWQVGAVDDLGKYSFDSNELATRQALGVSPLKITSVKLMLEVTPHGVRENLFRTLSVSEFANSAELFVAAPIDDEQLLEEIRQFALKYGVGVTSYGLTADEIDDLPEPAAIEQMLPREFEAILAQFKQRKISTARVNPHLNWQAISEKRSDNEDFHTLSGWIGRSIRDGKAMPIAEYRELVLADQAQSEFDVD